jgi:hypothetical protein
VYNFLTGEETALFTNVVEITSYTQGVAAVVQVSNNVAETFTLEVTGGNTVGGTITFNGGTVTIPANATLAQVVAAFLTPTVPFATYTTTAGATASTITFTETTPAGADIADSTHQVDDFVVSDPTVSGVLVATVDGVDGYTNITTPGVVPVTETFTVYFGNSTIDTTYTFDGEEIPVLAGETGVNIAQAAAFGDYANWTAALTGVGSQSVVFTSKTPGANVTDATLANWGGSMNVYVSTDIQAYDGFDMIDFSSYGATGVYVEGQGWVVGGIVAGQDFIYMDESATNANEYTMTERKDDGDAVLEASTIDTVVTAIGVLDFGTMQSEIFVPENFII